MRKNYFKGSMVIVMLSAALVISAPFARLAHAQMFPYAEEIATSSSSSTASGTISSASTTPVIVTTTTVPTALTSPSSTPSSTLATSASTTMPLVLSSQLMQIDNLFIANVSSTASSTTASSTPEILATNPSVQVVNASGTIVLPVTNVQPATCFTFTGQTTAAETALAIACPTPTPLALPSLYNPYQIQITSSTKLLLESRATTTLASFLPGDRINVYGLYENNGAMQAYTLVDLSRTTPPLAATPAAAGALSALQQVLIAAQNIVTQSSSTLSSTEMSGIQAIVNEAQNIQATIAPSSSDAAASP